MGIALTDEHRELEAVLDKFLTQHQARVAARAQLDAGRDEMPPFWSEFAELGMLGLHVAEEHGGSGCSLLEAAVVLERCGRALAPGPLLPTIWASAVLSCVGTAEGCHAYLPELANGELVGAVGVAAPGADEASWLVLGGELADLFLLPAQDDLLLVDRGQLRISAEENLDPTRRVGRVELAVDQPNRIQGARHVATRLGRVLAAAEAAGLASACVEMAAEYAKVREQFGRLIGTFQAVKHHAANMLVDAELATAAAWDAAIASGESADLAAAVATTLGLPAAIRCAQRNIQLHGGIGFTWEHDAHMYLRRASALTAMFGPARCAAKDVTRIRAAGVDRAVEIELPERAERYRARVRAFRSELEQLPAEERLRQLVQSGYAVPDWPRPWGLDADAAQQVVIDQELAGIERPDYGIGGWILRTLLLHGTEEQISRLVPVSLTGDLLWCQLFSEPNAGSDAAGIQTRAERVAGGWVVTGQKVWTTFGMEADRGFATVRTDARAPKRAGITTMVIDMHADGVVVRPLREATGATIFSEVFLNDVFVPDEDVVGEVNSGWKVAMSALSNERVAIGRRTVDCPIDVLDLYRRHGEDHGEAIGMLLAEEHSMGLLNVRSAQRAVAGQAAGPEGNVAKLLFAEHYQRLADLAVELSGPEVALTRGNEADVAHALVWVRLLSIGGGTAEIVRNQIAERILGLPRDPLVN